MKKTAALILAVVMAMAMAIGLGGASASAFDPDPLPINQRQAVWSEWRWPDVPQEQGVYAKSVYQGIDFLGGINYIASEPGIGIWKPGSSVATPCSEDLACLTGDGLNLTANGMFPLCTDAGQGPCVESLQYSLDGSDFKPADFLYAADARPTAADIAAYQSDSYTPYAPQPIHTWSNQFLQGVPASATGPLVFDLPGATNTAGTSTYALTNQFTFLGTNTGKTVTGHLANFEVNLRPVFIDKTRSGRAIDLQAKNPSPNQGPANFYTGFFGDKDTVAFSDKSSVGFASGFTGNLRVKLSLQLPNSIGGWLQGRAENPNVTITPADANQNHVVLEANPSTVPITGTEFDVYAAANAKYANRFDPSGYQQFTGPSWAGMVIQSMWNPNDGTSMLELLAPLLGNKAKGQTTAWNFSNLSSGSNCMSDNSSLQGLLTTNAMTYQAALPTYDAGAINYSVAGLHYDSSGQVFKGTYNFIMRDSVAKCLYGFKGTAPMTGTVSVTSSDGQENVAYTNVTDRDGWLKLTAQDFTFSNPTISAKLSQADAAGPGGGTGSGAGGSGGSGSGTGSSSGKKVTITCVKGKTVKKVSAANPKCPAGYKKK